VRLIFGLELAMTPFITETSISSTTLLIRWTYFDNWTTAWYGSRGLSIEL
jgi:hypothetical protein